MSPAPGAAPPTTPGPNGPGSIKPRPGSAAAALAALIARVLVGGAFVFAASMKIADPQSFAEAIQAFKLIDSDRLVLFGTHALPWIEMFAGLALVLGFWTRAGAFIIAVLLVVFIVAIISVLERGLNVHCGCFGKFRLACPSQIAWCKVWENAGLTAAALVPLVLGGGRWSLDAVLGRSQRRAAAR